MLNSGRILAKQINIYNKKNISFPNNTGSSWNGGFKINSSPKPLLLVLIALQEAVGRPTKSPLTFAE